MSQQSAVAVLGLGAMGHAFAANLLNKGFSVSGWNRTASRGEDLVAAGLHLCDTPEEAVRSAQVVITMLADGDTTRDVLQQAISSIGKGSTLIQMATIGVDHTDKLIAWLAAEREDVLFIDAPVSGTKAPAEKGQILIMASGDASRAQSAESVFAAIGKGTQWLGEAGQASRMKLVINSWLIGMVQSLAESMRLAERFGFSADNVWQMLEGGPLAAPYARLKLTAIAEDDFTPQMQLALALKDARLALSAFDDLNLPALENIASLWQQAVDAGYGDRDLSVIYRYLQQNSSRNPE